MDNVIYYGVFIFAANIVQSKSAEKFDEGEFFHSAGISTFWR